MYEETLKEARAAIRHAMMLEREGKLLKESGYFDATGRPRQDEKGKAIWEIVQKQMRALPPFTNAEVDRELERERHRSSR